MGNIVSRVGIESISLAFWASVLIITLDVTNQPTSICLCGSLPEGSVQTTTLVSFEV